MVPRTFLAALVTCVVSTDSTKEYGKSNENEAMCRKFGKNPYFGPEMVTGKPWRIYYSWNMRMDKKCVDMTFRNATSWTVNRFAADMGDYLEMQPAWEAALLFVTMGHASHQMLLFADQGPAGRVHGVPNIIRDANFPIQKKSVPLIRFQLKLIRGGKYLVVMDCDVGVVSLSARRTGQAPFRAEIASAAAEVGIGEGFPACTQHINKDEQFAEK